mgnify:FL=1
MKKLNTEYWKKLLETVAFSNGEISLYELVQKEHRHFHPSGNLLPSKSDTMMTDRMNKLCELMGIPLIDHVIVGGDNREFFSFKEKGLISNPRITLAKDYMTLDFPSPMIAERGKAR